MVQTWKNILGFHSSAEKLSIQSCDIFIEPSVYPHNKEPIPYAKNNIDCVFLYNSCTILFSQPAISTSEAIRQSCYWSCGWIGDLRGSVQASHSTDSQLLYYNAGSGHIQSSLTTDHHNNRCHVLLSLHNMTGLSFCC